MIEKYVTVHLFRSFDKLYYNLINQEYKERDKLSVATSSTEAEYMALFEAVCEAL